MGNQTTQQATVTNELLQAVRMMRYYQKRCEQYKVGQDLKIKAQYEKQVDELLGFNNPKPNSQQKQLF